MQNKNQKIYIAGHNGMAGSAIQRALIKNGYNNIITVPRRLVDLRNECQLEEYIKNNKPDVVIMCAAKVGGINANITQPVAFLLDNLKIQNNIISLSAKYNVNNFIFLASSCIYPRNCDQPMRIESLFKGELEPTNEGYALAKIAGIKLLEAYRKEYNFKSLTVIPCNLYGQGDSFDVNNSHVLSALVKKFVDAKNKNSNEVVLWGTGIAKREFLHVDDFASALLILLNNQHTETINIGSGVEISIKDLANKIAKIINFKGVIKWDNSKPDGMLNKLMDNRQIKGVGFTPKITLEEGIKQMITEYKRG